MKDKIRKYPLREVLAVGNLFHTTRLEIMVLDEDEDLNSHYRVNPNSQYSKRPVVDEVTMRIVYRIMDIMKQKNNIVIPTVFVAGHVTNGTPCYFSSTYGSVNSQEVARLLEVISRDTISNYSTPHAVAYMRRLRQRTNASTELIKRVLNAWAISNLVLEDERYTLLSLEEASKAECKHAEPVSLL